MEPHSNTPELRKPRPERLSHLYTKTLRRGPASRLVVQGSLLLPLLARIAPLKKKKWSHHLHLQNVSMHIRIIVFAYNFWSPLHCLIGSLYPLNFCSGILPLGQPSLHSRQAKWSPTVRYPVSWLMSLFFCFLWQFQCGIYLWDWFIDFYLLCEILTSMKWLSFGLPLIPETWYISWHMAGTQ